MDNYCGKRLESVEKLKNIPVFEKTGPFSGNFSEKGPVRLSTSLPCPSCFLHSPFTKCGENPGADPVKTNVMQQNAADKGTKKAIYFQNFRKSTLHPQKNSTTHEKVVEKNAKNVVLSCRGGKPAARCVSIIICAVNRYHSIYGTRNVAAMIHRQATFRI